MNSHLAKIEATYILEPGLWLVTDSDIHGLFMSAPTTAKLNAKLERVAMDLAEANGQEFSGYIIEWLSEETEKGRRVLTT